MCDDFAKEGYVAVAPALFDRAQKDFQSGYTGPEIEKARTFVAKPDWDAMLRDTEAALKDIKSVGPLGIIGFCMGGSIAFLSAGPGFRVSARSRLCQAGASSPSRTRSRSARCNCTSARRMPASR